MNNNELTDELSAFLDSMGRDDAYRVDRVLKSTDAERTELVYFSSGSGSELGPFTRKRIDLSMGGGNAYEVIWQAQERGARFAHLPRLIECCRAGDQLTVVMEYISGQTLGDLVAAEGASADLADRLMPGICEAVAELHGIASPPIIHRDLKPANIIVTGSTPVIIDFGIARVYREGVDADTACFGTRGYAAPEQYGFGQTSVRSDIFALGMLLFFCCTGRHPSGTLSAGDLKALGVPERLAKIALKAAAFDPTSRYESAESMREDLVRRNPVDDCASRAEAVELSHSSDKIPCPLVRVPAIIGRAWNAFLALIALTLFPACFDSVVHPNTDIASNPMWYNAAVSLYVLPLLLLMLLLFADRRRWKRPLPFIGEPSAKRIGMAILKVGLVGFAVLFALYLFV